jgi:hypothetical protein
VKQSPSREANSAPKSSEISPNFVESEATLQGLQKPSNTPHSESHQRNVPSKFCSFKLNFNIILKLLLGLPSGLFPSCFPTKPTHAPLLFPKSVACPASKSSLLIISLERSWSSSVWTLFQSPISSALSQHPIFRHHQLIFPCQCNVPKINHAVDI